MATQSKSKYFNDIHTLLKRRYKPKPDRGSSRLTVLEAVIYGICHEDTTREQANQALSRFKDEFFDWNEVRVSSVGEIQEVLAGIPNPEPRAQAIRRFLRQLFEKTYGFSLDHLTKKPLKEALKVLQVYQAFSSDYVTATVIQQALGGHALPIDSTIQRALERLKVVESDIPTLRAVAERAVPKNRGLEFITLLEELAHDTCVEGEPDCPRCELRKICPYPQMRKAEAAAAKAAASTHPATAKVHKDGVKTTKEKAKVKESALAGGKSPDKDKEADREKELSPAAKPSRTKPSAGK